MSVQLRSIIQCPHCGFKVTERMPKQERVREYVCQACQCTLTASAEECCVFCRYGSVSCPDGQQRNLDNRANEDG